MSNNGHLHQILGLFDTKWGAIYRKTQCILVLNAVRFGAKRREK